MKNSDKIEKIIGYTFKDKSILEKAMTHPSYAYEHKLPSYQKLEFLGDSILDFIIAEELMKKYPNSDEGVLTKKRANIVSKNPLADSIDHTGLDEFILLGNNVYPSKKSRSDIFESLVAGIYMDSKDIEKSREFIMKMLIPMFNGEHIEKDYKSVLLEYCSHHEKKVNFEMVLQEGPPHNPTFKFNVLIDDKVLGYGTDHSKKSAQQEAARHALKVLKVN